MRKTKLQWVCCHRDSLPNIFLFHSFLRESNGVISPFDRPGAIESLANGINDLGTITGNYADSLGGHGFLLFRNGSYITFDPPGSTDTLSEAINAEGEVTGYYVDVAGMTHGYVRCAF